MSAPTLGAGDRDYFASCSRRRRVELPFRDMTSKQRWAVLIVGVVSAAAVAQRAPVKTPIQRDMDSLRSDVKGLTERVETLEAQVEALTKLKAGPGKPALAPADQIAKGLKDRKLVIGMTIAQAQRVIGSKGDLVEQTERGDLYRFTVPNQVRVLEGERDGGTLGAHLIYITFRDGAAVAFRRSELPNVPARPLD
jgi:hypothetical protein